MGDFNNMWSSFRHEVLYVTLFATIVWVGVDWALHRDWTLSDVAKDTAIFAPLFLLVACVRFVFNARRSASRKP
jgi:hypothetical protein